MQTATVRSSLADNLANFTTTLTGRVVLGLAATLVVALAAHVSIPLPFTPVPLTLQPLAVLGVGLALGPLDGFLAMLAYLAEGAMGLPVFSPVGLGGVAQLLGPTGGFLMSYPLVAFIAGGLTHGLKARAVRFVAAFAACSAAMAVLYACGAGWFMHYTGNNIHAAWIGAVAPFLPGEFVKVLVAAGVYSTLSRAPRI
ncbi:MAG: biotin transporter BioY [Acidobacteriaceae bacterium]